MRRVDWPSVGIGVILSLAAVAFVAGFVHRDSLGMLVLGNVCAAVIVALIVTRLDVWQSEKVMPFLAFVTVATTSTMLSWRTDEVCPYGAEVAPLGFFASLLGQILLACGLAWAVDSLDIYVLARSMRRRCCESPVREPQTLDGWWITVLVSLAVGALSLLCPQSATGRTLLLGAACGGIGGLLYLWVAEWHPTAGVVVTVLWLAGFSLAMALSGLGWWTALFVAVAVGTMAITALAHVVSAYNRDRRLNGELEAGDWQ